MQLLQLGTLSKLITLIAFLNNLIMLNRQLTITQHGKRGRHSPMSLNTKHIFGDSGIGVILQKVIIIDVINLVGHIETFLLLTNHGINNQLQLVPQILRQIRLIYQLGAFGIFG